MTTLPFSIAPEPDPAALEAGRRLFAGDVGFLKGVAALSGLPPADRPEVCFAGRSNVGKSTLINALAGQKGLARASGAPGRTQEINYFTLADSHYLVDLPGYGYARAPRPVVERWQRLLKSYLTGRQTLRRVFLLIDARHGAKPVDEDIMALLDKAAVTFQVVLTKADKTGGPGLERALEITRAALGRRPAAYPHLIVTSAEDGRGLAALRSAVADID